MARLGIPRTGNTVGRYGGLHSGAFSARRPFLKTLLILSVLGWLAVTDSMVHAGNLPPNLSMGLQKYHAGQYHAALEWLQAATDEGGSRIRANTEYVTGLSKMELGFKKEALTHFRRAARNRLTGDWALKQITELLIEEGEFKKADDTAREFFRRFPYSALNKKMARLQAAALSGQGRTAAAVAVLRKHLREGEKDPEYQWDFASLLEADGHPEEAYKVYQKIYYEFPHTPQSLKAFGETTRMQNAYPGGFATGGIDRQITRMDTLMDNRRYQDALDYIKTISLSGVDHQKKAEILYKKGKCLKFTGYKDAAAAVWRDVIAMRPQSEYRPYALYRLAKIYWNAGDNNHALKLMQTLVDEYPGHTRAPQAYYVMGRIYESDEDYPLAFDHYRAAYRKYPKSDVAEESHWREGWLHFILGQYQQASLVCARFMEAYPLSLHMPKIYYWHARSLEKRDLSAEAIYKTLMEEYPFSYYAMLAERRDDTPLYASPTSFRPDDQRFPEESSSLLERNRTSVLKKPHLTKKQEWYRDAALNWNATGFPDRAVDLLERLQKDLPDSLENMLYVSYLFHQSGRHSPVIHNFWRVLYEKLEDPRARDFITHLMFPIPHWDTLVDVSGQYDIDPMLLLAIMRQESSFDPSSVSAANARGLMQIIPSTAERISRALDMPDFSVDRLHDPETNIKMGAFYINYLLKDHGGDLVPAIASYNAGKYAVKKWFRRFPYDDVEVFIERIPYPETRGYVKKVLRNYGIYRDMYQQLQKTDFAANHN